MSMASGRPCSVCLETSVSKECDRLRVWGRGTGELGENSQAWYIYRELKVHLHTRVYR